MSDWISVRDRLPEKYGRYPVAYFNTKSLKMEEDCFTWIILSGESGDWFSYDVCDCLPNPFVKIKFVTHWKEGD